jgi:hypothetical protein
VLRKDLPSPIAPESDEEKKPGEEDKDKKTEPGAKDPAAAGKRFPGDQEGREGQAGPEEGTAAPSH